VAAVIELNNSSAFTRSPLTRYAKPVLFLTTSLFSSAFALSKAARASSALSKSSRAHPILFWARTFFGSFSAAALKKASLSLASVASVPA
jgi:hypothetical protein